MVMATLREEARLHQVELAALVGCSQPYLSRMENGRITGRIAVIEQIAAVLSDRLGRTITADDLTETPDVCPTCRTPLAQTA
jgi:predicted transcriptional regulator